MNLPFALDGRKRIVLACALAVALLWVYYGAILSPLARAAIRTGQEFRQATRQLQDIEQALVQEPQLLQQQREMDARVAQLRSSVPAEDQLPNVLQHLTEVAAQTGIKVQSVTPQPSASKDPPTLYRHVPIQLDALAGYHQLGVFLSRVETEGPPMQLQSLRIAANPKLLRRHDVKMLLVASLALLAPPEEPAAGKRPSSKRKASRTTGSRKGARKP